MCISCCFLCIQLHWLQNTTHILKAFVDILIKARPSELNGYYLIYMHTQYEEHFSISVLSLTVHHKASRFDNTEYENIKAKTMEKTHTWEQHSA